MQRCVPALLIIAYDEPCIILATFQRSFAGKHSVTAVSVKAYGADLGVVKTGESKRYFQFDQIGNLVVAAYCINRL